MKRFGDVPETPTDEGPDAWSVYGDAFDDAGLPQGARTTSSADVLLDDLAWWARSLKAARAERMLPPAFFRQMNAPSNE